MLPHSDDIPRPLNTRLPPRHAPWVRPRHDDPVFMPTMMRPPLPQHYLVDHRQGDLEILIGWPQWMPEGATAIFVTAESDDGAVDTTEHMHSRNGQRLHTPDLRHMAEDDIAATLVLPYREGSSVTLHVMAESHPYEPPRSIGGTTVMLPDAPKGACDRRRLQLLAPLDINVELVCTPSGPELGDMYQEHPYYDQWQQDTPLGSWRVID
uniref:Uncharacterized protein n=1 Tax=Haptolina brevifila TaxID=156173 RepID=A0A7S2GQ10_9EUKA